MDNKRPQLLFIFKNEKKLWPKRSFFDDLSSVLPSKMKKDQLTASIDMIFFNEVSEVLF
jgi:hypothetical protein